MTEKKASRIERILWKIRAAVLHKRMKALYWASGCMLAVSFASEVTSKLMDWNPAAWQTVFAGLILAQLTKAMNNSLTR